MCSQSRPSSPSAQMAFWTLIELSRPQIVMLTMRSSLRPFLPAVRTPAMPTQPIHVIGAGLAGSEADWQAADAGAKVVLHEMRPDKLTEAHLTGGFAELV